MLELYVLSVVKGFLWSALDEFARYAAPHWNWQSTVLAVFVSFAAYIVVNLCVPTGSSLASSLLMLITSLLASYFFPWKKVFK